MSPATILHERGLRKNVQVAQLNMPFGVAWYSASCCEILAGASARAEAAARPSPAASNARRAMPRRLERRPLR
jgi:hypothetical protein